MAVLNLNNELMLFEVSGADAASYLQGQLTNDIYELAAKPFQYAAHLNNKGRILATFIILSPAPEHYYLITPLDVADSLEPRLKMFILRSKVSFKRSSLAISLAATKLPDCLAIALSSEAYLNIGPPATASLHEDSNAWHRVLVENHIPLIYTASREKIIPQQINYDLTGSINFKKGCYTGQEIVARTHYLGKVKRRLAYFSTQAQPQIGQSVISPIVDNQEVGFIVDYYLAADNSYKGLVSVQSDCLAQAFLDIEQPMHCLSLAGSAEDEV